MRYALCLTAAALLLAACGQPDQEPEADAALTPDEQAAADILEAFVSAHDEAAPTPEQQIVSQARACERGDAADEIFTAPDRDEDMSQAVHNARVGAAFLAANADNPCVFTLPSGLQFRVERAAGGPSPVSGELVEVHYEGRLIDGTVFDSSYARGAPATFPSDRLISGWVEALPLMNTGEEWTLFVPSDLAYGATPRPGGRIRPNDALIFRMELLSLPGRPDGDE